MSKKPVATEQYQTNNKPIIPQTKLKEEKEDKERKELIFVKASYSTFNQTEIENSYTNLDENDNKKCIIS